MLRQGATVTSVAFEMDHAITAIRRSTGGYHVVCPETSSATKFVARHSLDSSTVRDVIKYIEARAIIIERSRILWKKCKIFCHLQM
jgi:hypothetical protein